MINKRCPKCEHNLESNVSNLYKCRYCGIFVDDEGDFVETDLRRFELRYSDGFKEVYKKIYQVDIMKIINLLNQQNNTSLGCEFRKFLDGCKHIDNLDTDYTRPIIRAKYREILEI